MTDQTEHFKDVIRTSLTNKQQVAITGGNTKTFLGRATAPSNNLIKTTDHSGILSYEPVELIMQARSGTTLKEIEETLAEKGQCLSSEPALFGGKATIGGSVASNISGPSRPWAGALRDHILGVSLINGEGIHMRFGGQVMKNVAGYDVSRLQAGSMGTLGLMTDISFKVMPKWKYECSIEYRCDIEEALHICQELAGSEKPLLSASYFDGRLISRFATMENALAKSIGQNQGSKLTQAKAIAHWQSVREFEHPFFEPKANEQIWRISVLPNAPIPHDVQGEWSFDWAGNLRWLKGSDINFYALEQWAKRYNAHYYHWSGGDKTGDINPGMPEPLRKIHKNIKKAFDPHGLFNPGRLYDWM